MQQYYVDVLDQVQQHSKDDEIHDCPGVILADLKQHSDELLAVANKQIHIFPYKDVRACWFRLYTDASIVKALGVVQTCLATADSPEPDPQRLSEVVSTLDKALIMAGGLGREDIIQDLLTRLGRDFASRKRKREDEPTISGEEYSRPRIKYPVQRLDKPSLHTFHKHILESKQPMLLLNTLDHWPASQKWTSLDYWLESTLGGRRLVPVEIGRSYVDDDWGQELMSFENFLNRFILKLDGKTGYLAQHDLFKQIPSLRADIMIPDYCYLDAPQPDPSSPVGASSAVATTAVGSTKTSHPSAIPVVEDDSEVHTNIWFGPPWTISPLHHDPYHNILCQIVGKKYIRLYSPQHSTKLQPRSTREPAPHGDQDATIDMSNTSAIDVGAMEVSPEEDWDEIYPGISELPYQEIILEAGQALYIPVGWWHYVRSVTVGISVSFWWN